MSWQDRQLSLVDFLDQIVMRLNVLIQCFKPFLDEWQQSDFPQLQRILWNSIQIQPHSVVQGYRRGNL